MPDIQAIPLISEQLDSHVDITDLVDAAGNRFIGVLSAGNANSVTVYRFMPDGRQDTVGTVYAGPTNHKIDKVSMSHSGPDLLLALATHEAISAKPRSVRIESAVIPNVYVYRAGQEEEEGGAGAYSGTQGQPEPGGVEGMTLQELTDALANQSSPLSVALGKVVKNQARGAITTEGVVTEKMFDGADGSHIVYNQLRNTSYSGAKDAIQETHDPTQ